MEILSGEGWRLFWTLILLLLEGNLCTLTLHNIQRYSNSLNSSYSSIIFAIILLTILLINIFLQTTQHSVIRLLWALLLLGYMKFNNNFLPRPFIWNSNFPLIQHQRNSTGDMSLIQRMVLALLLFVNLHIFFIIKTSSDRNRVMCQCE